MDGNRLPDIKIEHIMAKLIQTILEAAAVVGCYFYAVWEAFRYK
jgi:hypothetical protein